MGIHHILTIIYFICTCNGRQDDQCPAVPVHHMNAAVNIWNFLRVNDKLQKSDVIIGLGSHDKRVAVEAANLWLAGWADILIFSGRSGNLTTGKWLKPEAEIFRDVAVSLGVPNSKILVETESTNTGENIRFLHKFFKHHRRVPKKIILVQKPHMGMRTIATFMKQWPDIETISRDDVIVRTPDILLSRYPTEDVGDLSDVITVMLGYLERLDVYYKLGYQTYQEVPLNLWEAFRILKKSGKYSGHLVDKN